MAWLAAPISSAAVLHADDSAIAHFSLVKPERIRGLAALLDGEDRFSGDDIADLSLYLDGAPEPERIVRRWAGPYTSNGISFANSLECQCGRPAEASVSVMVKVIQGSIGLASFVIWADSTGSALARTQSFEVTRASVTAVPLAPNGLLMLLPLGMLALRRALAHRQS